MGGSKRRRQQRVKAVGNQVEENIQLDAEEKKLKHLKAEHLYQVDNKGGNAPVPLTKKQKLDKLQNDPLLASTRKFDASKCSKSEILVVRKMQQQGNRLKMLGQEEKMKTKVKELWSQDGSVKDNEQNQLVNEYVVPVIVKKTKRRKLVASTKYKVPTVEVAVPGQSYHPDFDTHQDVLAEAVAEELERREKRAHMQEHIALGMSKETLQYIKQESSESEAESSNSDDEHDTITKTRKLPEKLTRAQRNKRSRQKQMEMKLRSRRDEKAVLKQINCSSHILQEIVKCEKEVAKKLELKKLQKEQKLHEEPPVRVAGKYIKLERSTLVSFSEELTGNLRTLKPKGNPLLDRFDSLHKRNQIEIGHPKKTRKAKIKIIETKK